MVAGSNPAVALSSLLLVHKIYQAIIKIFAIIPNILAYQDHDNFFARVMDGFTFANEQGLIFGIIFSKIQWSYLNVIQIKLAPWWSGYRHWTTSFNQDSTQALRRFRSFSQHNGSFQWWKPPGIVSAVIKASRPSPVNHYVKTIYHHHHHHHHHYKKSFLDF